MPAKQQKDEPRTDPIQEDAQPVLNALIRRNVLRALGQPSNLLRVQIQRIWEDRYRVNVFVGTEVTSVKVAHSYFLETDAGGTILASTPDITRHY